MCAFSTMTIFSFLPQCRASYAAPHPAMPPPTISTSQSTNFVPFDDLVLNPVHPLFSHLNRASERKYFEVFRFVRKKLGAKSFGGWWGDYLLRGLDGALLCAAHRKGELFDGSVPVLNLPGDLSLFRFP